MESLVDFLSARSDKTIETSCAWVFLQGERALKVKKPVDFGFLDYSTLEKRRWALERELAFNRAAAPDIYRAVHPITADGGGFSLEAPGEPVEYALEMRRFDDAAVLAQQPWAVDADVAERLGRTVARFHAGAKVLPAGGLASISFTIGSNAQLFRDLGERLGPDLEPAIAATDAALAVMRPLIRQRETEGYSRHCHGDLHLGNILLEHGAPVLFDCIEFNDTLSELDILYDLAFLLMDLDFRRRTDAANRVMNAYLDEAARHFPETIWKGLALLPLCQAVRAGVRCHVSAHNNDDAAARAYLGAALRHLQPQAPRLMAVGGVSGTGKTTLARLIAPGLGGAPGAVILRSDEVRKRRLGVPHDQPTPGPAYGAAGVQDAYDAMLQEAGAVLRAGHSVIVDATFIHPANRAAAEATAKDTGALFQGIWLEGDPRLLEARIQERRGDASDATVNTLRSQLARDVGPIVWERHDAGDLDGAARRILAHAGLP